MCVYKNYIFLFGGFQDTGPSPFLPPFFLFRTDSPFIGIRTTYLNDLWVWSLTDYRWQQIEFGLTERKPPYVDF